MRFSAAARLPPDPNSLRARFAPPVIFQTIPFSSIQLAKGCDELGESAIYKAARFALRLIDTKAPIVGDHPLGKARQ
jgi:hypothetical protein